VQQVGAIKMTPVEWEKGEWQMGRGARPGDTSPWDVQIVVFAVAGATVIILHAFNYNFILHSAS